MCSWLLRTVSRKLSSNSKDRNATTSLDNLCLVTFTVKKCFPIFTGTLSCFSLWPLLLSPNTTGISLAPPSLLFLYTLVRSSLWAFFPPHLSDPVLWSFTHRKDTLAFHHLCGASLDSLQYMYSIWFSLILASPKMDPELQMWPHQHWIEGKDHLPQLAASTTLLLKQPRITFAFFTARTNCCFIFTLVPHLEPQVLFWNVVFQVGEPQHIQRHGLAPPQVQDSASPLVEVANVPVSPDRDI